ncbi:hypothetical protein [Streptomyces sp. HUCO-GS316]
MSKLLLPVSGAAVHCRGHERPGLLHGGVGRRTTVFGACGATALRSRTT